MFGATHQPTTKRDSTEGVERGGMRYGGVHRDTGRVHIDGDSFVPLESGAHLSHLMRQVSDLPTHPSNPYEGELPLKISGNKVK